MSYLTDFVQSVKSHINTITNTSYFENFKDFAKSITFEQFITQKYTNEQIKIWENLGGNKDKYPFDYNSRITRWLVKKFTKDINIDQSIALIICPVETPENYSKLINLLDKLDLSKKHKIIIFHNLLPVLIKYDVPLNSEDYKQKSYLYKYIFDVLSYEKNNEDENDWDYHSKSSDLTHYFSYIANHWSGDKFEYWNEFLLKSSEVKEGYSFCNLFMDESMVPSKEIFLQMVDYSVCDSESSVVRSIASFIDLNYSYWKDKQPMKLCIEYLKYVPEKHIRMVWCNEFQKIAINAIKDNNIEILKLVLKYFILEKPLHINHYYDPMHYADHYKSSEMEELVRPFSNADYYSKTKIISQLIQFKDYMGIEKMEVTNGNIHIRTDLHSHTTSSEQRYDADSKIFYIEQTYIESPQREYISDVAYSKIVEFVIPYDTLAIKFKYITKDYYCHRIVKEISL